jgi:hypothetical protein
MNSDGLRNYCGAQEGGGSGNTFPDWIVVDAHSVELVAERMGTGNGRTYTITITSTDKAGLSATATVTVAVPLNQGTN